MGELYLTGVHRTAARRWLGVIPGDDGLTWFDLLGLAEGEPSAADVTRQVAQQVARVQACEQQAASESRSDYAAVARELAAAVVQAGDVLGNPQRCQQYRQDLAAARERRFRDTITPAIVAGKQPSAEQLAKFELTAVQLRLGISEVKRIVNSVTGVAMHDNPYAAFNVLRVADDPAWPTHFDLLLLDETTDDHHLLAGQVRAQRQRAQEMESKFTEMDRKRAAREFAGKIEQAGEVLLSAASRAEYVQEVRQQRAERFRQRVDMACSAGDSVSPDTIIQLLSIAQRMRLAEQHARQLITARTGFGDYFGLLGERKTPLLARLSGLSFDISRPEDAATCTRGLTVSNDGAGMLEGTATPTVPWLRVEPVRIATSSRQRLTVRVDPETLPRGVPVAGQIMVETNGGARIVNVEVLVAGGEHPGGDSERVLAAFTYLCSATVVVPLVVFFMYQRRSRYISFQSAQAAVLGTAAAGVFFFQTALGELIPPLAGLLYVPLLILLGTPVLAALVCAGLAFAGRGVRLPFVAERAEKFA